MAVHLLGARRRTSSSTTPSSLTPTCLTSIRDDTEASGSLRSMWWHLFAQPPEGSPYYKAAAEARTVTQHQDSLVADREAFRAAMIKSIAMVPATRPPPATGLSRPAAHARLAELATTALMDRGESAEDVCQVAAVFSATATKSAMPTQLAKECREARPCAVETQETEEVCRVLAGIVVHVATFSRPDVAFAAQLRPLCHPPMRGCGSCVVCLATSHVLRSCASPTLGLRRRGGWTSRSVGHRSSSRCRSMPTMLSIGLPRAG